MKCFHRYLPCMPLLVCLSCGGSSGDRAAMSQQDAAVAAESGGVVAQSTSDVRVRVRVNEAAPTAGRSEAARDNSVAGSGRSAQASSGAGGGRAEAGAAAGSGGASVIAAGSGGAGMPAAGRGGSAARDTSEDVLIPHSSWTCGMPEGIVAPNTGTLAFEVKLQLGETHRLGRTQFGDRVLFEITGGSVHGEELDATVMERGLDWQLTLPNGVREIEQVTVLRTDDGTNIFMRSCGVAVSPDSETRMVPDIEAPSTGGYSWLNDTKLVGTRTLDPAAKTMTLAVYKVDKPGMDGAKLQIEKPDSLPHQSWDCAAAMGERDSVLYMASVMIDAGTISVGASKRGTRNIVPITGGKFSGRISGSVLNGGADFQLGTAAQLQLDARYTLKTDDGELIIIRNCGSFTTAVPVYETREDGPYAFVNKSKWLATGTGLGAGAVNMTIYEAKLP